MTAWRTRRAILRSLAGLAVLKTSRLEAAGANDRGIGGTGAADPPPDGVSDRGIGGTGVIGTIRRFGSIVVNDLRIAYPPDVAVTLDGKAASAADLRVGHVVRVEAEPGSDGLATGRIAVTSEVVGPVEKIGRGHVVVLGQTVSTAEFGRTRALTVGETVAVSGLRRPDGTVVASLIEGAPGAAPRVAGPVVLGADGGAMIGGLRLVGLAPELAGQRVLVEGQTADGALAVRQASPETLAFGPGVRRLSVEAYAGGGRLGSGLRVAGAALPRGTSRVVLTGTANGRGQLNVTAVNRSARDAVNSPRAGTGPNGTASPAGRAPARPGSEPRGEAPRGGTERGSGQPSRDGNAGPGGPDRDPRGFGGGGPSSPGGFGGGGPGGFRGGGRR